MEASESPPRLRFHAARPEDLAPLASLYLQAGSAVVRAQFAPGEEGELYLPDLPQAPTVHPLVISLPSLAGLLVRPGDRVAEGEPIARRVDEAPLADLKDQAGAKRQEAQRLEEEMARLEERCRAEREALKGEMARLEDQVGRLRYLVSVGAEAPLRLSEAEGRLEEARARLTRLAVSCAGDRARLEASLREARLAEERLRRRLARAEEAQLIRSPVAGRVGEVKVRDLRPGEVVVEVVIVGERE
ncbi:HlyD family secretion protein [Thermus sediminis]|uniref:hypothetical protein n=1 Tax=Thermus sediminis TaxID=1761908 RepID=UPI001E5C4599|nr:hypothetical protein [Thermus sediminis]